MPTTCIHRFFFEQQASCQHNVDTLSMYTFISRKHSHIKMDLRLCLRPPPPTPEVHFGLHYVHQLVANYCLLGLSFSCYLFCTTLSLLSNNTYFSLPSASLSLPFKLFFLRPHTQSKMVSSLTSAQFILVLCLLAHRCHPYPPPLLSPPLTLPLPPLYPALNNFLPGYLF